MNQKIEPLWNKIEQKRLDLFLFLEKQDPSVLNQKPAPEKWSANQNVLHLIEAETASLAYMKKKLSFGFDNLQKAGFKSWLRRLALRIGFMLPIKVKAPANLSNLPDNLNLADLKMRWANLRAEYITFFAELPELVFHAELWRHQIAGKMNLAQMLDFFDDHVNRHRGQIERTLKELK
jgi:uncharacterized damage-inducible protein DinB